MFFGYIKRTWLKQVPEYASHSTQAKTKGIIIISPQIGTLLKANKWRAPGGTKIHVYWCAHVWTKNVWKRVLFCSRTCNGQFAFGGLKILIFKTEGWFFFVCLFFFFSFYFLFIYFFFCFCFVFVFCFVFCFLFVCLFVCLFVFCFYFLGGF